MKLLRTRDIGSEKREQDDRNKSKKVEKRKREKEYVKETEWNGLWNMEIKTDWKRKKKRDKYIYKYKYTYTYTYREK